MLSAQRKEFEEKKKDESPYPQDFARWNALDYFRRPRGLRAQRFYYTLGATLAFTLFSLATAYPALHRAHQSAPVSNAHGVNHCASCHDQSLRPLYRVLGCDCGPSTSDRSCRECHKETGVHHAKQTHEPACAACHREHQGHETLANHVADRNCVECHGDLPGHVKPGETPAFHGTITAFHRDHPEFKPAAKGKKDPSRIKFNHKAHLDLDIEALRTANEKAGRDELKGLGPKMACADCHQMDDERRYLKPIQYDNHCARCHALNVALVGDFAKELKPAQAAFSKTPAPHKEPALVRGALRDRFVDFAQTHNLLGKAAPSVPRPLPWKQVSDEHWNWASSQVKKAEAVLFMNKQWQKTEPLTWCSHCHIESAPRAEGALPVYEKTDIPLRWYKQSVFNHGSHRTMACVDCHDSNAAGIKVADSKTAADILLPNLQTCQKCHSPTGGARSACVECHRYHERPVGVGLGINAKVR